MYNEIILITSVGSLPFRVSNYFKTMRKVGKCHQNVLAFYKGDKKENIKKDFGEVEVILDEEEFID